MALKVDDRPGGFREFLFPVGCIIFFAFCLGFLFGQMLPKITDKRLKILDGRFVECDCLCRAPVEKLNEQREERDGGGENGNQLRDGEHRDP